MELLKDDASVMGAEFISEATSLVAESGQKAKSLLRYFRVAYGASGGESIKNSQEAFDIIDEYLKHYKIQFEPVSLIMPVPSDDFSHLNIVQLLFNAILVLQTCLPRGGSLTCRMGDDLVDDGALILSVSSEYVRLSEDIRRSIEMGLYAHATNDMINELTPRNVQGYFIAWLAQKNYKQIDVEDHIPGRLRLIIRT